MTKDTRHMPTRSDQAQLAEAIQGIDFDSPFTLNVDGTLTTASWAHAPEVHHVEGADGVATPDIECGDDWYPILHGYSGQEGYRGAVMHSSERISEGIAERLLAEADSLDGEATFVVVTVEVLPDEDEDIDPFPAGWTILARPATYGAED